MAASATWSDRTASWTGKTFSGGGCAVWHKNLTKMGGAILLVLSLVVRTLVWVRII